MYEETSITFHGSFSSEGSSDALTSELSSAAMEKAVAVFEKLYTPQSNSVRVTYNTSQVINLNRQGQLGSQQSRYRLLFYQPAFSHKFNCTFYLTHAEYSSFFVKLISFYVQELFIQAHLTNNPKSPLYDETLESAHGMEYSNGFANRAILFLDEYPSTHFQRTKVYQKYFGKNQHKMKPALPPRLML